VTVAQWHVRSQSLAVIGSLIRPPPPLLGFGTKLHDADLDSQADLT
jgi:hypothetical protein